jgi:hypothetical protein
VALSLKQPWAWAILFAGKDVENRTWRSRFRGRVILHASRTIDAAGVKYLREAGFPPPEELPMGAYVGEVVISDCRPVACCASRWAFGPWCYTLQEASAYETPIVGPGRLGFYPVPPEVVRLINAARRGKQSDSPSGEPGDRGLYGKSEG